VAQQADYFALPDREVDTIDGEEVAIPTRQLFRFDHYPISL
jgi:hypothetical protein